MNLFSDKEKQLFRNSKFHVILSTIFSQLTPKSNSYSAMVSHWCHLISHVPKHKTHPNLVMTQHIRECSNPSARWDRDSGITSSYAKTQDCSIFSTPMLMMHHSLFGTKFQEIWHHPGTSPSICFTYQFTGPYMTQVSHVTNPSLH